MFGLGDKKGQTLPERPFSHADDCKIFKADPIVQIPWNEEEPRYWVRTCVCAKEYHHEPYVEHRVRLDPFDPGTARHLPQCEYASTTDPGVLRLALRIADRAGYSWVECAACQGGWQVPYFAEENVG